MILDFLNENIPWRNSNRNEGNPPLPYRQRKRWSQGHKDEDSEPPREVSVVILNEGVPSDKIHIQSHQGPLVWGQARLSVHKERVEEHIACEKAKGAEHCNRDRCISLKRLPSHRLALKAPWYTEPKASVALKPSQLCQPLRLALSIASPCLYRDEPLLPFSARL